MLAQPVLAVAPTILSGLVLPLIFAGLCPSSPNSASACAMAEAEYRRPANIVLGTTSTTALHATHR